MGDFRNFLFLLLLPLLALEGFGATISIGDFSVDETVTSFDVPVQISGGESVTDLAGVLIVNGGGSLTGGVRAPDISSVSYAGSIWEAAPSGFTSSLDASLATREIVFPNVNLNSVDDRVTADGLLLTFTLDLSGFGAGESFGLSAGIPSSQESELGTPQVPTTYINGSITIVPEPGSVALAVLGIVVAVWGVRRRADGTS